MASFLLSLRLSSITRTQELELVVGKSFYIQLLHREAVQSQALLTHNGAVVMEAVERTGRRQCWDVAIISPAAPRNLLAKIRQEELEVQGPLFRKGVDDVKLLDHLLRRLGIPASRPLIRVGTLRSIKTMLLYLVLSREWGNGLWRLFIEGYIETTTRVPSPIPY